MGRLVDRDATKRPISYDDEGDDDSDNVDSLL
jgi:hypothetical protein